MTEQNNCMYCKSPCEGLAHHQCNHCIECGKEVSPVLCHTAFREGLQESLKCSICLNSQLRNEVKDSTVLITQEHLDSLNKWNLLFKADMELNTSTNQVIAGNKMDNLLKTEKWLHEMPLEEQFVMLKRMEACCATWSIAMYKHKDRIDARLNENERNKFRDAQEYRRAGKESKDKKIAKSRESAIKMNPEERIREKAILGLMAVGLSREKAIETMESARSKFTQGTVQ